MSAKRGSKATPRRVADGPRAWAPPPHGFNHRSDDGNAFMPDPEDGPARIRDDLAENLAEDYVQAATQGMEVEEDHDQIVPEEIGGPFVETTAADEFAHDTDEANPEDASREPLPRPVAGLVMAAPEEEETD
jgi:hypothetical protein